MKQWVLLKVLYDEAEAEILRGLLEGSGIEVKISSYRVQPYPVNIGRLGEIKILVPEDSLEEARKLLEDTG